MLPTAHPAAQDLAAACGDEAWIKLCLPLDLTIRAAALPPCLLVWLRDVLLRDIVPFYYEDYGSFPELFEELQAMYAPGDDPGMTHGSLVPERYSPDHLGLLALLILNRPMALAELVNAYYKARDMPYDTWAVTSDESGSEESEREEGEEGEEQRVGLRNACFSIAGGLLGALQDHIPLYPADTDEEDGDEDVGENSVQAEDEESEEESEEEGSGDGEEREALVPGEAEERQVEGEAVEALLRLRGWKRTCYAAEEWQGREGEGPQATGPLAGHGSRSGRGRGKGHQGERAQEQARQQQGQEQADPQQQEQEEELREAFMRVVQAFWAHAGGEAEWRGKVVPQVARVLHRLAASPALGQALLGAAHTAGGEEDAAGAREVVRELRVAAERVEQQLLPLMPPMVLLYAGQKECGEDRGKRTKAYEEWCQGTAAVGRGRRVRCGQVGEWARWGQLAPADMGAAVEVLRPGLLAQGGQAGAAWRVLLAAAGREDEPALHREVSSCRPQPYSYDTWQRGNRTSRTCGMCEEREFPTQLCPQL